MTDPGKPAPTPAPAPAPAAVPAAPASPAPPAAAAAKSESQGPGWSRFHDLTNEAKGLRDKNAGLEAQVATLRAEAKTAEGRYGESVALIRAGFDDPIGQAAAREAYKTAPADGRPETLGAYLDSLKAEGAVVPKGLTPYIAPPTPAAAAAPNIGSIHGLAPQRPRPTATTPPANGDVSNQRLAELQQIGDLNGLREHLAAMGVTID